MPGKMCSKGDGECLDSSGIRRRQFGWSYKIQEAEDCWAIRLERQVAPMIGEGLREGEPILLK